MLFMLLGGPRWPAPVGCLLHPKSAVLLVHPCRFELCEEDMAALDGLESGLVTGWNPIRDDPV